VFQSYGFPCRPAAIDRLRAFGALRSACPDVHVMLLCNILKIRK
jgi:hypothetical protein